MARDRELILKRIAYQIAEADKAKNIASVYARGEILGLTSLREFIEASIPAAEEVERWAIVSDGLEFAIFESKENAEGYKLAWGMDGVIYPVAIRRLEDKA
jgi:hypothetical protein